MAESSVRAGAYANWTEASAVGGRGVGLLAVVRALRPRQWIKNGLLFAPLAFSANLHRPELAAQAAAAFTVFCALSSAGYLLNDVLDVEADRRHPTKRLRPVAAGQVPLPLACGLGLTLAVGGVAAGLALGALFGALAIGYVLLTATYSLWLKHLVLLDVFGIAAGFVLRAAAGAAAIVVPVSPWLYIATFLGALLVALGKRRAELQTPAQVWEVDGDTLTRVGRRAAASEHRKILQSYSTELIDQLILVVSSAALMTYALYTFSAETLPRDHSMMLTIPVVLYGLTRYLFLVRCGAQAGAPEELLLHDRPLLIAVALWGVLSVAILYVAAGRS